MHLWDYFNHIVNEKLIYQVFNKLQSISETYFGCDWNQVVTCLIVNFIMSYIPIAAYNVTHSDT